MGNLGKVWDTDEFTKFGRDEIQLYIEQSWQKDVDRFQTGDLVRVTLDSDAVALYGDRNRSGPLKAEDHRIDQITAVFLGSKNVARKNKTYLVIDLFTQDEEHITLGWVETNKIDLVCRPGLEESDDEP